ncbi:MAG: hypothetical protein IPI58_06730 [Alphaproteobacteria bacterium]|nr:MAG: hypothetical protein IPI58_06730 [Alphaproteobacteria bacterium]
MTSAVAHAQTRTINESYFPLHVESRWTYRCTTKGEDPFTKTVTLGTEPTIRNGLSYLSVTTQIGDNKNLASMYYYADSKGIVWVAPTKSPDKAMAVAAQSPKPGEKIEDMSVAAAPEIMEIPALGTQEVMRLENFSLDDSEITDERRTEWRARYYARGVGLVAESDGLGNSCELTKYRIGAFTIPPKTF